MYTLATVARLQVPERQWHQHLLVNVLPSLIHRAELGHVLLDEVARFVLHVVVALEVVYAAAVLQLLQHHEMSQLKHMKTLVVFTIQNGSLGRSILQPLKNQKTKWLTSSGTLNQRMLPFSPGV